MKIHPNLRYSKVHPRNIMDVYVPDGQGTFPLILWVHGGGWKAGDKSLVGLPFLNYVAAGFAVASMNYRYSSHAKWPAQYNDVACAVRFLHSQAPNLQIDEERIGIMGASAGGHLALYLGFRGDCDLTNYAMGFAGEPSTVKCVVSFCAPTDFLEEDAELQSNGYPIRAGLINSQEAQLLGIETIYANTAKANLASPYLYLNQTIPCLVQHSPQDRAIPYQQSQKLAGGAIIYEEYGTGHGISRFIDAGNTQRVLEFFQENL